MEVTIARAGADASDVTGETVMVVVVIDMFGG